MRWCNSPLAFSLPRDRSGLKTGFRLPPLMDASQALSPSPEARLAAIAFGAPAGSLFVRRLVAQFRSNQGLLPSRRFNQLSKAGGVARTRKLLLISNYLYADQMRLFA